MPLIQGQVGAIASPSISDSNTTTNALMGKSGELVVTELHGKWYTQAYRGKLFHGSTLVAGTIIPISTSTAPTFTLYNPLGSGVNAQLVAYDMGHTSATIAASPIGLAFLSSVGASVVVPSAVTALTVRNGLLGAGNTAACLLYSAATIVAATYFKTMLNMTAVAGYAPLSHYEFDGTLILPPGTLVHVCGLVAQTAASTQNFVWTELPI